MALMTVCGDYKGSAQERDAVRAAGPSRLKSARQDFRSSVLDVDGLESRSPITVDLFMMPEPLLLWGGKGQMLTAAPLIN